MLKINPNTKIILLLSLKVLNDIIFDNMPNWDPAYLQNYLSKDELIHEHED